MARARFERAIVTGASSGIGAAMAWLLTREGSETALVARRRDRLEALAFELSSEAAGKAFPLPADVSDPDSLAAAAAAARARWDDGIDLLVVAAGFAVFGKVEEIPAEKNRRMFETNVLGAIETIRLFLPALKQRRGVVVVITSLGGRIAAPGMATYCATKFALHGFLDALRFEVARDGVAIVEVCPGPVETEFFGPEAPRELAPASTRVLRSLSADEVARAALEAAARRKRRVTLPTVGALSAWLNDLMPGLAQKIQGLLERR